MKIFTLERSVFLPHSIDRVFDFFARAENLESLTPPLLKFEILTPVPIEMRVGAMIDYRLRLHGIPLRWRSEITVWDPPYRFVDEQRRGPYRLWIHEHRFREAEGGTWVDDEVKYAVPGGTLIRNLFVAPNLREVFNYRHEQLRELFDGVDSVESAARPAA